MCDEQRKYAPGPEDARRRGTNQLNTAADLGRFARGRDFEAAGADVGYVPALRERLLKQQAHLASQLSDVNDAIAALDADPEFEKHERTRAAVQRTGQYFA